MEPASTSAALAIHEAELVGYSSWSAERIARFVLEGGAIGDVPGDFVVVARGEERGRRTEYVISSVIGVLPYFYVPSAAEPVHGRDVFALARRAGLEWRWNERALRCLAWIGHTAFDDTIHLGVRRIPPCAALRFCDGAWTVTHDAFWRTVFEGPHVALDEAASIFEGVMRELASSRPLVPLSAGFDSRALLAGAIASGARPALITMGRPESTDRVVASAIARDLGLEHHIVELAAPDYLAHAAEITRLTSGTKTASNWHTYLYARRCGEIDASPTIAGSNGEFARTYYLDMGLPAAIYGLAPARAVTAYFAARIERRRRSFPVHFPFFGEARPAEGIRLARDLASACADAKGALDALDLFYATQRMRHFIGNGHALYDACARAVSPFLDARWIRASARLARRDKLGSAFHRRAIARSLPRLLEYPIRAEARVSERVPRLYWTKRASEIGYSAFADVLAMPETRAILLESTALDTIVPREARRRAVEIGHRDSLDLLLTLHFAAVEATSRGSDPRSPRP